MLLFIFALVTGVAHASEPKVPVAVEASLAVAKPNTGDLPCVKAQLEKILVFEKTHYSAHQAYSASLEEVGVPKDVIAECSSWSDPVVKTTYGGSGLVIRSENPDWGEVYTLNQEGRFVKESMPKHKASAP